MINNRKLTRYNNRQKKRNKEAQVSFEEVFSVSNLLKAQEKCTLGVGWKGSVQYFRNHQITNLYKAQDKLSKRNYKSIPFYEFNIHERGKERNIKSLHISERVVQKCLCDNFLTPLVEKRVIYDNAACRKDKGVDFSRKRMVHHLRNYYINHGFEGYALTFDFSKYFNNIDHEILINMLSKIIEDSKLLNLIKTLIKDFGEKGLGLGSQISQTCALFYPTAVDKEFKEKFKCKYYGRYMDDGYIIHKDKEFLIKCRESLFKIANELNIKINPKKTQIIKLSKGIVWLKTRYILTKSGKIYKKPYKKSIVSMRRKLKKLRELYEQKKIKISEVKTALASWLGYIRKSNSYRSQESIKRLVVKLFKGEIRWRY